MVESCSKKLPLSSAALVCGYTGLLHQYSDCGGVFCPLFTTTTVKRGAFWQTQRKFFYSPCLLPTTIRRCGLPKIFENGRNHNHRPCRWFAQAPLGPITSRTYRFIESSFYCMMRPTAIEIAAWRILLFVSPWLSVFLNHTLSPAFQTCSSLRSDIFSGHS